MKVECGQLIDDDAHKYILALTGIHAHYQTIEDKRIQCSNDTPHFRVVGDKHRQSREFVVVDNHSKAFGTVLPDERLDNRKDLTQTRRSDNLGASERIDDVDPALAGLSLVVVPHRDVNAILVLLLLLTLFEALVLKVEAVFEQTFLEELGYVVECDMHQYDGREHIEDDVQKQGIEAHLHRVVEEPHREYKQHQTAHQRIQYLTAGIKLQMFFVARANAGYADKHECGNLAVHKIAVVVNHPPLDTVVNIHEDATPVVKCCGVNRILEELHQYRDVDDRTKYLIKAL